MSENEPTPTEDDEPFYVKGTRASMQSRADRMAELERVGDLALENPNQYLRDTLKMQAKMVHEMQRKALSTGHVEDKRFFMEAIRECRYLAAEVRAILESEGDLARSERFLQEVAARLQKAAPVLAESLRPVIEPDAA